MSSRMLSWKKGQKSPFMGNLEVFLFHFGMTFYFGISLGMEILRVCQFKSAVIQLLLIHKINNFMSCFLIHRSLVLVLSKALFSFRKEIRRRELIWKIMLKPKMLIFQQRDNMSWFLFCFA